MIVTKQSNPYYHSNTNRKTEFRLDTNNGLNSEWRIGFKILPNPAVELNFFRGVGASAAIKTLSLYSENILLDSTTSKGDILSAWINTTTVSSDNNTQKNLVNNQIRNNWYVKNLAPASYAFPAAAVGKGGFKVISMGEGADDLKHWDGSIWLDLTEYLPLLNEIKNYRTLQGDSMIGFNFKNLKLVIDWNSGDDLAIAYANQPYEILEPVLVYEEIQGGTLMEFNNFNYFSWEMDKTVIPAVALNTTQTSEVDLNGFRGKMVSKLLFTTIPLAAAQIANQGKYCSAAQPDQQWDIVWNNLNYFQNPVDNVTKNLYTLYNNNKCQFFGNDIYNLAQIANIVDNGTATQFTSSMSSWLYVDMQNLPVTTLKVKHTRKTAAATKDQGLSQLDLVAFGLVSKSITVNPQSGSAVIKYQ